MGLRFRFHRTELPGRPDIAFPSRRTAVFVNGCFRRGHDCARGSRHPKQSGDYRCAKRERNKRRDAAVVEALRSADWTVAIVWECELWNPDALQKRLLAIKFVNADESM